MTQGRRLCPDEATSVQTAQGAKKGKEPEKGLRDIRIGVSVGFPTTALGGIKLINDDRGLVKCNCSRGAAHGPQREVHQRTKKQNPGKELRGDRYILART